MKTLLLFVAILLVGCASQKKLTPEERKDRQMREASGHKRLTDKGKDHPYPKFLDWTKKKNENSESK